MPTRRRPPQHQMRYIIRISHCVLQRQESAETAADYDDFLISARKMHSQTLDVGDDLLECIWFRR